MNAQFTKPFIASLLLLALLFPTRLPAASRPPRRFALVVGVKTYPGTQEPLGALQYTENDAVELSELLTNAGYDVTLMTESQRTKNKRFNPGRAQILRELQVILSAPGLDMGDAILIAFAGHGACLHDNPSGKDVLYFLPTDADLKSRQNLIAMDEIYERLKACRAGTRMVVMDACRNDPSLFQVRKNASGSSSPPPGVVAYFSCSAGERAYEDRNLKHGVFFHFLLQGIRGEADFDHSGQITVAKLTAYVGKNVTEFVRRKFEGAQQVPEFFGSDQVGVVVGLFKPGTAPYPDVKYRYQIASAGGEYELKWLKEEADAGNPAAMSFLGQMFRQGVQMPPDLDRARKLFEKASAAGSSDAMTNLGVMYEAGEGVTRSDVDALKWYRKAAEADNVEGLRRLAKMYASGRGAPQNYTEAMKIYRQLAQQGDVTAMKNLAELYEEGHGVPQSYALSFEWYKKAAEGGNARAMVKLGMLYEKGHSAEDEAVWRQRHLGVRMTNELDARDNIPQNYVEAFKWEQKSAEAGDTWGMDALANLYIHGKGVPQNYPEAFKWLRRAADGGLPEAMVSLCDLYVTGQGGRRDYAEAMRFCVKAADVGSPRGMGLVGYMYREGLGVPKDYAVAVRWFRKGVAAGDGFSMAGLSVCYQYGLGVPRNLAEADRLVRMAADAGEEHAKAMR